MTWIAPRAARDFFRRRRWALVADGVAQHEIVAVGGWHAMHAALQRLLRLQWEVGLYGFGGAREASAALDALLRAPPDAAFAVDAGRARYAILALPPSTAFFRRIGRKDG